MFSATTFIAMQHNRSRVLQLQHTFFSQLEDLVRGAAFLKLPQNLAKMASSRLLSGFVKPQSTCQQLLVARKFAQLVIGRTGMRRDGSSVLRYDL